MRVAEICPDCATYINATCIIYDGPYLSNLDVSPLDSLDSILEDINSSIPALSGSGSPTTVPSFYGQLYIDTSVPRLYVGMGTTTPNWGLVGVIITTTTTTSTSSTTTTTTTTP
jgi:hypothetical protein